MRRTCGNTRQSLVCSLSRLKPGLHIVVTIAEHAWGHVLKRVLMMLIYRSQTFVVKYKHIRSLQLCEDQGISGNLKKTRSQPCACDSYDLYGDQALVLSLADLQSFSKIQFVF